MTGDKVREFEFTVDEALRKGLSPDIALPANSPFLYQAFGFRIGRAGIEPYVVKANPLPVTIDMHYVWPFPQYITGEKYNFLIVRDPINEADIIYHISDDHQTVTFVFAVDELTFGQGWIMDVADFGEYAFMANGKAMVFWNIGGNWNSTVGTATVPLLGTVCNLNGQLIGGNVRSVWHDCDSTFYAWSKIGYAIFTPDEENEAGYKRCPYGGDVFHVRRLGGLVVGYSSKGISFLRPVSEPTVTLGCIGLLDVGLLNRGAVNGDDKRQVFVGEDYILREVTEQGIQELGFRWLMESLSAEDIIISYDPSGKDFYIGNSTKTFLLSPQGMSEIQQHPSGVWRRNKQTFVLPSELSYSGDAGSLAACSMGISEFHSCFGGDLSNGEETFIASWPVDFTYAGQKTNQTIELSGEGYSGGKAAVDYKNNGAWGSGSYSPVNNEGIATVIASGNTFRFKAKFSTLNSDFKLGHIKSRYKMTDMRGIRGVYAPPLRGQI